MKHLFKALKQIGAKQSITPAFKSLDPNPNTLKRLSPDLKTIKKQNLNDFEDYIDGIFKSNPHLSEKEMYEIYHDHKNKYDLAKAEQLRTVQDEKNYKDLLLIKEKLLETTDKRKVKKLGDEFISISSRLNK